MSTRPLIPILLALAAAGTILLLWPKEVVGPEEEVRRAVVSMTREAEEKDLGAVMEFVSERFKHPQGLGRRELKGFLAAQLLRGTWVRIFVTGLETELVSANEVKFRGRFVFARSDAKTPEELAADTSVGRYQVDAVFELEPDGKWRVVSASHQSL